MKKIVLFAVLATVLVACDTASTSGTSENTSSKEEPAETYNVGNKLCFYVLADTAITNKLITEIFPDELLASIRVNGPIIAFPDSLMYDVQQQLALAWIHERIPEGILELPSLYTSTEYVLERPSDALGGKEKEVEMRYVYFVEAPGGHPAMEHLKDATAGIANGYNGPQIMLNFGKEDAQLFENLTRDNIGKPLAIGLDHKIISAPTVMEPISGGKVAITGNFTEEQLDEILYEIASYDDQIAIRNKKREQNQ